jgi:uncharacterized protein (DUF2461 family)
MSESEQPQYSLPPLPRPRKPDENGAGWFTAGQMHEFAAAAIAQAREADLKVMRQAMEALEDHAKQYPHMQKGYTLDAIEQLRKATGGQP